MPRGKHGKRGTSWEKTERLEWDLEAEFYGPYGGGNLTKEEMIQLRDAAASYYLQHGTEMEGVHLIGIWRNPDNRNPLHANWKNSDEHIQGLGGFFETIIKQTGAEGIYSGAAVPPVRKPPVSEKRKKPVRTAKKAQTKKAKLKAKEAQAKAKLRAKAQADRVKEKAQAVYKREREIALAKAKETIAKAKAKAQAKVQAAKLKAKVKKSK
jgi:hypothetical protein